MKKSRENEAAAVAAELDRLLDELAASVTALNEIVTRPPAPKEKALG